MRKASEKLYELLSNASLDILYDDRIDVRPGFKFMDADLIGVPIQVIIGKKNLKDNNVEIKIRRTGARIIVGREQVVEKVNELLT